MTVSMRFSVEPKDYGKYEKRLGAQFKGAVTKGLQSTAKATLRVLRAASAAKIPPYTGAFQRGWRAEEVNWHKVEISNTAKHAPFVERGRKPGKMPPIDAIKKWATAKGKPELAWAIAKAIAKRGIKARPVLTTPTNQAQLKRIFDREMEAALDEAVRGAR